MHDELVNRLRAVEEMLKVAQFKDAANLIMQTAEAIEELEALSRRQEVELVELTGELASKPRPEVKCIDCQRDCQMIGIDMPACTAYEPPEEGE